jgi:hypothetical protein
MIEYDEYDWEMIGTQDKEPIEGDSEIDFENLECSEGFLDDIEDEN